MLDAEEIICIRETRWLGGKAEELGNEDKVQTRNEVGTVVSRDLNDEMINVKRTED